MTGTIKWFEIKKKFGFIQCDYDKKEYFVHVSGLLNDPHQYITGTKVFFELGKNENGIIAINVDIIEVPGEV